MLHTEATACERGEDASAGNQIAVWVRVIWRDRSETLGFVSVLDSELIRAMWPTLAVPLSRLRRPRIRKAKRKAARKH